MSSLLTLAGNSAPTGFYDFPIEQSLRFEDGDSAYLSRTPASAGNQKTFTISAWVKRTELPASYLKGRILTCGTSLGTNLSNSFFFGFDGDESLSVYQEIGGATSISIDTNAVYRDVSAWLNVICSVDTTQATASDRLKLYVNGEQITSLASSTYPSLNTDCWVNDNSAHWIGRSQGSEYSSFYLAEYNLIDGQALDPTSFGEFKSGIFIPKDTAGLTFGTNGFRLQFGDSAAIGDDTSGNTNDWTVNSLVASDVVLDSPTNNFAVVPSTTLTSTGYSQHTEGNLQLYQPSWGGWDINIANFNLPSSGKYYWEVMPVQGIFNNGYGAFVFGIGNIRGRENISGFPTFGNPLVQVDSRGIGEYRQYPAWVDYTKSGSFGFTVGSTVYGIAVDCDAKKFWFSLDNSWAGTSGTTLTAGTGDPANGTNGDPISGDITDYVPFFNLGDQQSSCKLGINFGQDSTFAGARAAGGNADANGYGDFVYAPPSGFLSLCSANLPSGAIDTLADETPEDYFNTVLYTGNGSTQSITGVNFQPDMVWYKARSAPIGHGLEDAVRGVSKILQPDREFVEASVAGITSFNLDGFSLGSNAVGNQNTTTYASWNWKAGGSGVSNTDGSITSTVSVGATSQQNWFSVVTWTGTSGSDTIGHGLGTAPKLIITKTRSVADNWIVYHEAMGATKQVYLDLTNAQETNANIYSVVPTSSVFTIGSWSSTRNFVSYCFADAEGLCKVGSYTGNGSADGPMIWTGHRPAFLLIKRTDSVRDWGLIDTTRDIDNPTNKTIIPNVSDAEYSSITDTDILSNGFKPRTSGVMVNASGSTYIYLAIAEQPFKYANAR